MKMPNNITHLPTDETLESGLSLIAQALDGDKISQISAKLSSQSKNLSQIDSFLADNLSGINTKLVAKGSTAASLYSEIPGKIESIEAASTPFRLLKNLTTPIVVTNGSFTVSYEGEPPADLMNNWEGNVLLPTNRAGVNLEDINYTISNVDTVNKTITFSLQGQTDGVLTDGVGCAVAIGGKSGSIRDYEILSIAVAFVVGLPVNYDITISPTNPNRLTLSESQKAADYVLNFENEFAQIAPNGVSPSASITISAFIIRPNGDYFEKISLDVDGFSVTIPANTVQTTATLVAVCRHTRAVVGSIVIDVV